MTFGGLESGGPPNGTQAHDLSREPEFGRPAQVGATPFWTAVQPPSGAENKSQRCEPLTKKCYRCIEPRVLPMY